MKKYEYVSVHIGKLVGAKSEEQRNQSMLTPYMTPHII